jgi:hypothetical protein
MTPSIKFFRPAEFSGFPVPPRYTSILVMKLVILALAAPSVRHAIAL